jgi:hypothetical protein
MVSPVRIRVPPLEKVLQITGNQKSPDLSAEPLDDSLTTIRSTNGEHERGSVACVLLLMRNKDVRHWVNRSAWANVPDRALQDSKLRLAY